MSVESLALVLHHADGVQGTDMVVLIGIANHDGDGGAWPSVATLAKYASVGERQVQKSLARLCDAGVIVRHLQEGGTARSHEHKWLRPNLYTIELTCPPDCDGTAAHRSKAAKRYPQSGDKVVHSASMSGMHQSDRVNHRTPGVLQDTPPGEPQDTLTVPINPADTSPLRPDYRTREAEPAESGELSTAAEPAPEQQPRAPRTTRPADRAPHGDPEPMTDAESNARKAARAAVMAAQHAAAAARPVRRPKRPTFTTESE